jgi:hypothetical protein
VVLPDSTNICLDGSSQAQFSSPACPLIQASTIAPLPPTGYSIALRDHRSPIKAKAISIQFRVLSNRQQKHSKSIKRRTWAVTHRPDPSQV